MQDQNRDRDDDIRYQEVATFDRFLDSHPEVAEQLRKDPSLVDSKQYMDDHATLRDFLEDHPAIRAELQRDPNAFMRDEARYERHEDFRDDHHDNNNEPRREEVTRFSQFLDSHREIQAQLMKDPSLADNETYLRDHPELRDYLRDHPEIRETLQKNPDMFMGEVARLDRMEDRRDDRGYDRDDHNGDRDHDGDRRDMDRTRFDQFLDSHRETAEALHKNPDLCNNEEFLKTHPALQAYLQQNPDIRTQLKANPSAFVQQPTYQHREGGDSAAGFASFGAFLGGHASISDQLSKDPTLVKNQEFLQSHPELRTYLNAHPEVQQQLMQNPETFVKSAQQFNSTNGGSTVKNPTPNPKQPQ